MTSRTPDQLRRRLNTASAIRDFIKSGGRILVTPAGELTEAGGAPWPFLNGSDEQAAECLRAGRVYFSARDLPGSEQRISRIVRILGRQTESGWLVLEARHKPKESLH